VPYVIKQLMADCAGHRRRWARSSSPSNRSLRDSAAVARMRRAGLVIVGRTNTSEFGLAPTTEPAFGGRRSIPGADLSPAARRAARRRSSRRAACRWRMPPTAAARSAFPASLCGLFGLKPSRGRISLAPIGETLAGAGAQHCVSISVRDSAALLDAVAGGEPGDPYRAPPPSGTFLDATKRRRQAAVAFMRKPVGEGALDPGAGRAIERTASAARGARPSRRGRRPTTTPHARRRLLARDVRQHLHQHPAAAGGRVPGPDDLGTGHASMPSAAGAVTRRRIHPQRPDLPSRRPAARRVLREARRAAVDDDRAHQPAARHRAHGRLGRAVRAAVAPMTAFTAVCNATGVPAMSVPIEWTDDGLPIGMHFVARFGAEETLYALAAQLEQARPWRNAGHDDLRRTGPYLGRQHARASVARRVPSPIARRSARKSCWPRWPRPASTAW
jgi:amidase